jgi:predicted nucleic acid-binding protein
MIALDTSVLVESLGAGGSLAGSLRDAIEGGERVVLPTLVLYEWLRGPRVSEELRAQEALVPKQEAIPFGPDEASVAARLYREVGRPRGREVDLAIAACALTWNAALWTLNGTDFRDVPGLRLWKAE